VNQSKDQVTNLFFCGVGGQGILLSSEIAAAVAFQAGLDVKKSEVHGMAQRGGSVTSNVRFGPKVYSPLIPAGKVDYLIAFHPEERDRWTHLLHPEGHIVEAWPGLLDVLPDRRCLNIALLGALSNLLDFSEDEWIETICSKVRPKFHRVNLAAFSVGRKGPEGNADR
jgi:indolepyruvate ferredoxin oxidoreductase beta subunit